MKQSRVRANRETDAVGWAREESIRFSRAKVKRYGILMAADLIGFVLMLKGMPGHFLWPYLGPLVGIALVCLVAITGFYLVGLMSDIAAPKPGRTGGKTD